MKTLLHLKAICIVSAVCLAMSLFSNAQTFETLASFGPHQILPGGIAQGINGDFYSVSTLGGVDGWGAVVKITPPSMQDIYDFCSLAGCADGSYANPSLTLGADGNLYGTTYGGNGPSTVFKLSPSGKLTNLYDFCSQANCVDGLEPEDGVTQGLDGNFYGATFRGGTNGYGTVYEITSSGKFTSLYSFCSLANCADGSSPHIAPIQGMDGNIYGTTQWGGTHNLGSVFRLTHSGQLKTLVSFRKSLDSGTNPMNLIQATDGSFYGITDAGGATQWGTVFKIDTAGTPSTLYSFCSLANCADGGAPSSLVQGPDGNLYGTTGDGGCTTGSCAGSIFQLTPQGVLTTLYTFCTQSGCADGSTPVSLMLATDGNLYGITFYGGNTETGTAFKLSMGFSPFIQPNPAGGSAGRTIGILGNNLTGTTTVTFNGTPAVFTVVSDTLVRASVPSGATTGPIQVTTPNGTLSSVVNFQVR